MVSGVHAAHHQKALQVPQRCQSHGIGYHWHAAALCLRGMRLFLTWLKYMGSVVTCNWQTVALGFSSFCDAFTEEEWKQYEYYNGESGLQFHGP